MRLSIDPGQRRIMPDYALPDALCVPFWEFDIRETLQSIAAVASAEVGVILIGPDPAAATARVAEMPNPEHFAVVSGAFDSPWIRDYAPFAVTTDQGLELIRPRHHIKERPNDTELFGSIMPSAETTTDAWVASGNLVPGPDGLAVSTYSLLAQNKLKTPEGLEADAERLGIVDWLFVPPFPEDVSRHSDGMVRFLGPELCAVACHTDEPSRKISEFLIAHLRQCRPELKILKISVSNGEKGFTSPLNWIQLGQHLLVPKFENAPNLSGEAEKELSSHGFRVTMVPSATAGLGGALRCLTAAIFS